MECDAIRLKIKLIHTKKEERLVINNLSVDYKNKRVTISTQKYSHVANMEEYVHNLTLKTRQQNKFITPSNVDDTEGCLL